MKHKIGPIILIVLGVVFLANNLDLLRFFDIWGVLSTWWPLILIAVGVGGLLSNKG